MDEEYQLSALRVQRNVMKTELDEDERDESERLARIEQEIAELSADG